MKIHKFLLVTLVFLLIPFYVFADSNIPEDKVSINEVQKEEIKENDSLTITNRVIEPKTIGLKVYLGAALGVIVFIVTIFLYFLVKVCLTYKKIYDAKRSSEQNQVVRIN